MPAQTFSRKALRLTLYATALLSLVLFSSCGKLKKIAGIGDFGVRIEEQELMASLVLTKIPTDTGFTVGIPELNSGFVEVGPAPKGTGTMLRLRAPITSILDAIGNGLLQEKALPDGRWLPGTTAGRLPAFDLTAGQFNLRFYVSGEVFGFFVPVQLPRFGSSPVQVPIYDDRGYVVAYGIIVPPAKNRRGSGVLVFVPVSMLTERRAG